MFIHWIIFKLFIHWIIFKSFLSYSHLLASEATHSACVKVNKGYSADWMGKGQQEPDCDDLFLYLFVRS